MEKIEFNIRHLFIIVASELPKCAKVINNIYKKNEKKYFNLYLNSGFKNDLLIQSLSYTGQKVAIELVGVLEDAYANKNFYVVEKIISAFDNKIVRICKKGNVIVDNYCKKKLDSSLSEFDILAPVVLMTYYLKVNEIPYKIGRLYYQNMLGKWNEYTEFLKNPYLMKCVTMSEGEGKKALTFEEEKLGINAYEVCYLLKTVEMIKSKGKVTLNDLIDNVLYEYEVEVIKNEGLQFITQDDYFSFRRNLFDTVPLFKEVGSNSLLLKFHGLNDFSVLMTKEINLNDLNMLLYSSIVRLDANRYDLLDLPKIFLNTVISNAIISDYIEVKDTLLNRAEIEKLDELKLLEEELNRKSLRLEKDIVKFKGSISKNNTDLKDLKNSLKNSSNEVSTLKKELTSSELIIEQLKEEVASLTKRLNKEITANTTVVLEEDSISIGEKIKYLKEKNIAIVGGANNIKNILNTLPNVFLFNEVNKNTSMLYNYDFIFINSDFVSHSLVYKINSSNLDYNYISGTNFELMIATMYNLIKKSEI